MRPCQAAPAFDTTMSTPPKFSTTLSNPAWTEAASVTSQRTASAAPPIAWATERAAASFTSSSATSAPAAANALAVAAPIAPAAPVIAAIWPASGNSFATPSLACSSDQYSQSNMSASEIDSKQPMASASVMVSTAACARSAAILASFLERGGRCSGARRKFAARLRRLEHERPVLGADGVIRRHHAGGGIAFHIGAVDEIQDGVAAAELQDQAAVRAVGRVLEGAGAAHDGRCFGEPQHPSPSRACGGGRGGGASEHGAATAPQRRFGQRYHFDHALIGGLGAVAEGEDPVLVENEAMRGRVGFVNLGSSLREPEARHDIGHNAHAAAINLSRARLAVRLVDQAEDRGGMGMIDKLVGQERVQ